MSIYQSRHKYEVGLLIYIQFLNILIVCPVNQLVGWEDNLANHEEKSVVVTFDNQLKELEHQSLESPFVF